MPTIAAGASAAVTLQPGFRLTVNSGSGVAVHGPGPTAGMQVTINGPAQIGPFAERALTLYLTAGTRAIDYDTSNTQTENAVAEVDAAGNPTGVLQTPRGKQVSTPGSGSVAAPDLATLNSTYPAATNAGKSAYVSSLNAFYDCNGVAWVLRQAGGGPYVMTSISPKADQLNTPATNKTTTTLAVDGRYLRIDYRRTGATSNGTVLYVALNATTSTEADTILGSPSLGRYAIPIGSFLELEFPENAPLRRIDISSDAASETANSTIATIVYGVAA